VAAGEVVVGAGCVGAGVVVPVGVGVGVSVGAGAGVGPLGEVVVGAGAGGDVVGAGWLGTDRTPPPATRPAPEPRAASRGCVVVGAAELVGAGAVVAGGRVAVGSRFSGRRGKLREISSEARTGAGGASDPPAVNMAIPRPDPEMITAVSKRKAFLRPGSSRR